MARMMSVDLAKKYNSLHRSYPLELHGMLPSFEEGRPVSHRGFSLASFHHIALGIYIQNGFLNMSVLSVALASLCPPVIGRQLLCV